MIDDRMRHPSGNVGDDDVAIALSRILESRPFRNSNQCSGLLRYIVEHSLSGEENLLRERVIGAELFGRPADYETSEDPVVRLRVSEVRKRLAQYYVTDRDQRSVQIEIPSGSYRAKFQWNVAAADATRSAEAAAAPESAHSSVEENGIQSSKLAVAVPGDLPLGQVEVSQSPTADLSGDVHRGRSYVGGLSRRLGLLGALCLILVAVAFTIVRATAPDKAFRAFWAPWVGGTKPVIISVGSNAVYRFQFGYLDQYAEKHGLKSAGQEFYIPFAKGQTLSADDLYPAYQSFVALGDVASVSRIVATLTEQKKPYQERFPNDVSFAELRVNPSVLVGGFNNPMTLELTKQLQFVMRGGDEIIDTLNTNRKWQLSNPQPETADYAIITRLVQRNGDAPFISIAGLGQYGTLAAAELVCSPTGLRMVIDKLPRDWADKNLQVVLRVTIVDFKPSASEVVASKSW